MSTWVDKSLGTLFCYPIFKNGFVEYKSLQALGLNQIVHLTSPSVFCHNNHFSVSFNRIIETSVVHTSISAIPSILVGMSILLLASLHLSQMNLEIPTIPTSHTNMDVYFLQKTKMSQTDHHFRQEPLQSCLLQS